MLRPWRKRAREVDLRVESGKDFQIGMALNGKRLRPNSVRHRGEMNLNDEFLVDEEEIGGRSADVEEWK